MKKHIHYHALLTAVTASALGLTVSTSHAQTYQHITHKPTGLNMTSCSTTDGTGVTATFDTGMCSQWQMVTNGNYFHIENATSGKYIRPETSDNGSDIVIRPNTWTGNWTQWSYDDRGDGSGHLVNRATGKHIYVFGNDGDPLQLQPSTWRGDYTRWSFVDATPVMTDTPTPSATPTPTHPPCTLTPTQYEAESGTLFGGARTYNDGAASGEQGVAYISTLGAGFSLTNVAANLDYIDIHYTSQLSGEISVRVNGEDVGNASFSATGSWVGNYTSTRFFVDIPQNATIAIFFDQGDTALNVDYIAYADTCAPTPTPTPTMTPIVDPPSELWTYNSHNSTADGATPHNNNGIAPLPRTSGPDFLSTPVNGATPTDFGFAFDITGNNLAWRWGPNIVKGPGDSSLEMHCSEDDGQTYTSTAVNNGTAIIPCSEPYVYFFRYTHPRQLNNDPASAYIYTGAFTTESRVDVTSYPSFTDGSANWMNFRHPIAHDGTTSAILDATHNANRLRFLDRYTMWVDDAPGNVRLNYDLNGFVIRVEAMRNAQGNQNGQQFFSTNQAPGFDNLFSYGQVIQFEMTAVAGGTGAQTYNDFVYYTVGHGFSAYGDPRLNSAGRAGSTMWFSDTGVQEELEKNSIFTRPITTAYREQDMDDFIVGHHLVHGVDPLKRGSTTFDDPDVQIGERTCGSCHFRDGRGSEVIATAEGPRIAPPLYGVKLLESIVDREAGFGWTGDAPTVAAEIENALRDFHNVDVNALPTEIVDLITAYTELLTVPNRNPGSYDDPSVTEGEGLFTDTGCASCHTPTQKTRADIDPQWANLTIRPYTDMKIWNLGSGNYRTAPLWGLSHNIELLARNGRNLLFMHDGSANNIEAAIQGHNGEAANIKASYNALDATQKQAIVNFVRTL